MKVTRELEVGNVCTLNNVEQKKISDVMAICDQLAYHLRGSELGEDMATVVPKLESLLKDTDLAPPSAREEP